MYDRAYEIDITYEWKWYLPNKAQEVRWTLNYVHEFDTRPDIRKELEPKTMVLGPTRNEWQELCLHRFVFFSPNRGVTYIYNT